VLPTGRNFYSLDNRTVPTPTAWTLGQKSAEDMLVRHFQDFGQYPKALGLSAWGTSNMRTGGDDIAQALALIGAKPVWEPSSWRVTGFEIVPWPLAAPRGCHLAHIGFLPRCRSPQIELLDKAIRAIGSLDEDEAITPCRPHGEAEALGLQNSGIGGDAKQMAGYRISAPSPGLWRGPASPHR
jgi:cobaltochelatase CobN